MSSSPPGYYLIDTDHCVEWLRSNERIRQRFLKATRERIAISEITAAELYFGAAKSLETDRELQKVEAFLDDLLILPLSRIVLRAFAVVKRDLQRRGEIIEDFDLLIGCTAREEGRILISRNWKHYRRIPGLQLEQWIDEDPAE